jgi:hypothetical protein
VNGRVYADRLEHDYKFECEAGPLHLCNDWVEFRRCFEWLAVHATPPAQPAPVQEPVAWIEHEWSGSGLRHLHFERREQSVRDEVMNPIWTPLYTTPPAAQRQWVGLTDEEVTICHSLAVLSKKHDGTDPSFTTLLHQQIEAKLKEKNT